MLRRRDRQTLQYGMFELAITVNEDRRPIRTVAAESPHSTVHTHHHRSRVSVCVCYTFLGVNPEEVTSKFATGNQQFSRVWAVVKVVVAGLLNVPARKKPRR